MSGISRSIALVSVSTFMGKSWLLIRTTNLNFCPFLLMCFQIGSADFFTNHCWRLCGIIANPGTLPLSQPKVFTAVYLRPSNVQGLRPRSVAGAGLHIKKQDNEALTHTPLLLRSALLQYRPKSSNAPLPYPARQACCLHLLGQKDGGFGRSQKRRKAHHVF